MEPLPDPPDADEDEVDDAQEEDAAPETDHAAHDGHSLPVRSPEGVKPVAVSVTPNARLGGVVWMVG